MTQEKSLSSDIPRSPVVLQVLAFAVVYLIWGSTYVAIRVGVQTMPPFLMAGSRFTIAGICLLTVARIQGLPRASARQWATAALCGVLMLTVGNGLVTWAETSVPSNIAALLVASTPLHMALLDWVRPGGVRPRARVFLGIALGLGGVVLLVTRGSGTEPRTAAASLAVIVVLVAAFSWALGTLLARHGGMHASPLVTSGQQMISGGTALLLISALQSEPLPTGPAGVSTSSLVAFAYLTIFGSMVAFSAYIWLTRVSTPARLSTITYVNLLVAVVLGWVFLGESLTLQSLWGAGLIVVAVVAMTAPMPRFLTTTVRAKPAKAR